VRALMERGAIFIGGDSGPMHVASTTDIPIVVLFGPTTAATWAPWRPASAAVVAVEPDELPCRPCDQRVCEPGDYRCLRRLEPAVVIDAARRLLERAA
jgi:heptosyltransferase-2